MSRLVNCPRCGKVFVYVSKRLCPECLAKEEEEFRKVKDYLWEHPDSTIEKVSEATGVSTKKILEFLREGRLMLTSNNPNIILKCERCGAPINTGRFCAECSEVIIGKRHEMPNKALEKKDIKEIGKMHTLNMIHKRK